MMSLGYSIFKTQFQSVKSWPPSTGPYEDEPSGERIGSSFVGMVKCIVYLYPWQDPANPLKYPCSEHLEFDWLIDCRVWHCFTHRKVFVNLNQIVSLSEKHQGKLWLRTLRRPTFRSPWGQGWVAGTEGVEALWRSYITSLFPVHICSQFGWGWIQGHGTTCNYGCLGNMEGTQMNIYNGLTSHLQSIQTENTCSSCQSILKRLKSIFLNRVCCGTVRRKHDKTDCWSEDGRKPWPERLLGCRWEGCRCLWSFHVHSLKLT